MAQAATPRRSSARLRNQSNLPRTPATTAKLSALVERDETPDHGVAPRLNLIAASAPPKAAAMPSNDNALSTPSMRIKPSVEEMHPSKFQSTTKTTSLASPSRHALPSERAKESAQPVDLSPSKTGLSAVNPFTSPTFEFRFNRPSNDLSPEARKLMGEVRDQAAKIKSQLFAQRADKSPAFQLDPATGRPLANPKGKIGRFSDIHLDQFKKMASIADHPSAFRAVDLSSKQPSPTKSLKRSNSKANLDKSSDSPSRSPSTKSVRHINVNEQSSSPLKRTKTSVTTSTPSSRLETPTKASLARSQSVKSTRTAQTKIPKPTSSPSSKSLVTPKALKPLLPNTDGKIRDAFTSKLAGGVRSILRRPQLKFSDDPVKIAAGTHISTPQKSEAAPIQATREPSENPPGTPAHRKEKHVNFFSSPGHIIPSSPVPSPSPVKQEIKYPALPNTHNELNTPTRNSHFTNDTVRASVVAPIDFTFRAQNTISFSSPKATKQAITTPTIRQVRNSNPSVKLSAPAEGTAALQAVPHGLSNKKRKRVSPEPSDMQEDKENAQDAKDANEESPTKKPRVLTKPAPTPAGKSQAKKPKTPGKEKGRAVLSLSRLNALAKPKNRQ